MNSWKNFSIAYLDFLRNLTIQIVLLGLALFVSIKLDFDRFDISNALPTIVFFVLLLMWLFAALANAFIFIEKILDTKNTRFEKYSRRLKQKNFRTIKLFIALFVILKRFHKKTTLKFLTTAIIAVIIADIGIVVSMILGISTATNLLASLSK